MSLSKSKYTFKKFKYEYTYYLNTLREFLACFLIVFRSFCNEVLVYYVERILIKSAIRSPLSVSYALYGVCTKIANNKKSWYYYVTYGFEYLGNLTHE